MQLFQNRSKLIKLGAVVGLVIVVAIALLAYWRYASRNPETDDAYVGANVVYVAPQVGGKVEQVNTQDYQNVQLGQVLFTIDPAQYDYALQQAQAEWQTQLAQQVADQEAIVVAQAAVAKANAELFVVRQKTQRIMDLVQQKLASAEAGDEASGHLLIAEAEARSAQTQLAEAQQELAVQKMRVASALAAVLQAKLNVAHTIVRAPISGSVANFSLRPGAIVTPNQNLFAIVDTAHWWVTANYKETALANIHPGQQVKIYLDMYPGQVFKGTVTSISRGSGDTFSLLPAENASGNWVKVTQRFPVRVAVDVTSLHPEYPFRIGASASVQVLW